MKWQNLSPFFLYVPVWLYVGWHCFIKKVSPAIITNVNPMMSMGGLAFESKSDFLSWFDHALVFKKLEFKRSLEDRLIDAEQFVIAHGYPVILKPDKGHRGVGVTLCQDWDDLKFHLIHQQWDMMLQEYCDWPLELGVFYCRYPNQDSGWVESITEKQLPSGMVVASHARGARFIDRSSWISPKIAEMFNQLCQSHAFYFGRFDIKSPSQDAFEQGQFKIIEVNGATSEFIHIYDDKYTYGQGIKELRRQWRLLIDISSHISRVSSVSFFHLLRQFVAFFRETKQATGAWW